MNKNKFLNLINTILLWLFIIITTIHVLYATFTIRIAYMDGVNQILQILNSISANKVEIYLDIEHTRFLSNAIMQMPIYIASWLKIFTTKYSLAALYSFVWFAISPILIYWNYKLSKRTNNYDTFIIGISLYSMLFLLYQIFAVVETPMTILMVLIIYNYITARINYTLIDKAILAFLVIILFSSHELILFCGPIIFAVSIFLANKESNKNNRITKLAAGIAMLFASAFDLLYIISIKGNEGEIARYLNELIVTIPFALKTNFLITAIGLIILTTTIIIFKSKKEITPKYITIFSLIIFYVLFYMIQNLDIYINPVIEGHYRVADIIFPLILFLLAIKDIKGIKIPPVIQNNVLTITILTGIALTLWQMNNTYWWNKNIEYMQNKLKKCESPLYVPDPNEHPISKFFENDRRNYIWHADYTAISILLAKEYKIKTILGIYDKQYEDANATERNLLFPADDTLHMPYVKVKIKNKFWDLTEPAKALDIYNTTHKIKTN